ncbi:MAG: DUF2254 domain-containing protein [Pseudomonadota bacterium]|nr:DUF2254 domain-containing protein [Pseudomonadota bacterium]
MNAHLQKLWDLLRGSLWFVPMVLAITATVLAISAVAFDRTLPHDWLANSTLRWLVYSGDAQGASLVLSTIAGSAITIAGTVFSMTLVALSLASQQLGPRLLRNFMRDRVNQVVLGTFISTFIYGLLVLRTIRRQDEFVPHLAVTLGVGLALASLAVLIYFIHHVSVSIQADAVINRVGRELLEQIDRLFPHDGKAAVTHGPTAHERLPADFDASAAVVAADADGYLQQVDLQSLVKLAQAQNLQLRLEHQPGDFLITGQPLLRVWPPATLNDTLRGRLLQHCATGDQRTSIQDFEFVVRELVEIAVRALSPGINDPFTAMACLDRLGAALYRLAQRELPSPERLDPSGRLRLVVPAFSFVATAELAFTQIRQNARGSSAVHERLLDTLLSVAAVARRPGDRTVLREQAGLMAQAARAGVSEPAERRGVEQRHAAAVALLSNVRARRPG